MPDGTVTEKAFLIACGNASQYGNNAYIAPHASMQDGKIDVTVLMPFTPFDTAALALLLFTKHIDQDSNIKSFTTESLTIKREKPGAIHLDGEPIEMGTRIDVRCFKGGLHARFGILGIYRNRSSGVEYLIFVLIDYQLVR